MPLHPGFKASEVHLALDRGSTASTDHVPLDPGCTAYVFNVALDPGAMSLPLLVYAGMRDLRRPRVVYPWTPGIYTASGLHVPLDP